MQLHVFRNNMSDALSKLDKLLAKRQHVDIIEKFAKVYNGELQHSQGSIMLFLGDMAVVDACADDAGGADNDGADETVHTGTFR